MPIDTPVNDLVRQLSRVGLRPDERLVKLVLDYGTEARAPLLSIATHLEALREPLPASLGPLHALRLLGEIPDVSMIEPLLAVLPVPLSHPEHDIPGKLYALEILQMIGRVGAPAVPVLWAIAGDDTRSDIVRGAAINALSYVATYAPETREEIVAEARQRLETCQSPVIGTGVVTVLADLGDKESYKAVMAAYRDGHVDQQKAPAAMARQFLLSGGRNDLVCVKHPLWERYDHHGPEIQDQDAYEEEY